MNLGILILLLTLPFYSVIAQDTDFIKGHKDLIIGTDYAKLEKLLEKDKVIDYFSKEGMDDMITKGYITKDELAEEQESYFEYTKYTTYQLKKELKNYKSYMNMKVEMIELRFDKDMKLAKVLVFLERTADNIIKLQGEFLEILGPTLCASGAQGPPSYYCTWEEGDYKVKIFDWTGIGESEYDDFLWVDYSSASFREW